MGQRRKATETLKLNGTHRLDRHGVGPPSARGEPVMPRWLKGEAKRWWMRNVPLLIQSGIVGEIDSDCLAAAASWWQLWQQANTQLQDSPTDYKATLAANAAWKNFVAVAGKFGVTPADRERVRQSTKPPPEENPLIELANIQ